MLIPGTITIEYDGVMNNEGNTQYFVVILTHTPNEGVIDRKEVQVIIPFESDHSQFVDHYENTFKALAVEYRSSMEEEFGFVFNVQFSGL